MIYPWELSILDGEFSTWLNAVLNISGNTIITGDLDVSGEIIGGAIPIENLSNVDEQSFENLIDNGDFKVWPDGDSSAPGEWTNPSGAVAKSSENVHGSYSAAITYSSATAYISTIVPSIEKQNLFTLCALVKSSTASNTRIKLNSIYSNYHSGGGDWELLSVTATVPAGTAKTCLLMQHAVGTVYFDGVILVEGKICPAFSPKPLSDPHTYGEMYIYNNSNATVIETANTPIALRQISGGLQKGFIFDAGSTGVIAGFSDYSGTVAGAVAISDAGHGLATGDVITIRGTTNYNGIFEVTVINEDFFYIMDTWVADDGASDWDKGASLTAQAGADGVYTSTWQMTTAPAGACELCFMVNINETPQDKSTACRDMAINDKDNNSSTCLLTIAENDIIWLSVESDSTNDITNSMGNINLERVS